MPLAGCRVGQVRNIDIVLRIATFEVELQRAGLAREMASEVHRRNERNLRIALLATVARAPDSALSALSRRPSARDFRGPRCVRVESARARRFLARA